MSRSMRLVASLYLTLLCGLLLAACGRECPAPPPPAEWRTEVLFQTFPYKVRLTYRPALGANQTAVLFTCGLGYRCGADGSGLGYFSEELLQMVRDAGLATAAVDLTGSGGAYRDHGDQVGLDRRSAELYQVRWEVLGRWDVVYVGHSMGAATAIRAAAKFGGVRGVAGLGFAPFAKQPNVPPKVIMDLGNQGPYIQFPTDLRRAFFFNDTETDAAGYSKDLTVSDPFPRKLFSDALALFQDPGPLALGEIRVPVYLQQYQADAVYQPSAPWPFAKTELFADLGHSAELHRRLGLARAALVTWLKQFVK